MDPTGCPPGYATDRLLYPSNAFPECKESMIAYWVTVLFSVMLRLFITYAQIRIALHLRRIAIENHRKTRIPLTTVAECGYTLLSSFTYISIGFNVVDAKDGSSISLLFSTTLIALTAYILSCFKLVNLGDKIIPRAVRNNIKDNQGADNAKEGESLSSVRRDKMLLFLFTIVLISTFLTFVLSVIVGGIVYKGTHHEYVAIGLALLGVMNAASTSIILRQTSRVVHYIRGVNQKQKSIFGDRNQSNQGDGGNKLEGVIKRLHFRAYMICLCESACIPLFFVPIFTPMPWYLAVAIFASSSIGEIGSTLLYKPPTMQLFGSKKASNTGGVTTNPSSHSNNTNKNNQLAISPKTDQRESITGTTS